jgi:hypothetical protein
MIPGMAKKMVLALVAAVAFSAPLRAAELKYTIHMEARAAAGAATDPMSAMAGGMISQMFPAGGIDQVVIVGDKGMRSEQKQEFAGVKAGQVTLLRTDGTQYVLDPAAKTYYKMPAVPAEMAAMMAQMQPKVTMGKTGVFETIDGVKCEKLTMTMTMPIPGIDPSQLPPGMPTELSMVLDMWMSEAVKLPASAGAAGMGMVKQFGFDQLPELKKMSEDRRLPVKMVMSMFGIEMVMTTKDIKSEAADPALFEIPKDYKEVPPPGLSLQPSGF